MIDRLSLTAVLARPGRSYAACASAPSPSTPAAAAAPAVDVVELSAAEARDRMAAGTLTARALTEAYLARIAAVDKARSGAQRGDRAEPAGARRRRAARRRAQRPARPRGPLHGLPVLLKDNIDAVGMVNSAGSLALADHRPASDAFLVTRLRDVGRGDPRQDQPERVGQLPLDPLDLGLELARRPDPAMPTCSTAIPAARAPAPAPPIDREPRRAWRRHRDRRQHPVPRGGERPGRPQADGGRGEPQRHHPDLDLAGHGRADDPHGDRRGAAAVGDRRPPIPAIPPARRRAAGCRPTSRRA